MTVGELRAMLEGAPDDVLVCVEDHYGSFVPLDNDWAVEGLKADRQGNVAFVVPRVDIGDDPE